MEFPEHEMQETRENTGEVKPSSAPVISYATPALLSKDVFYWRAGDNVVVAREHSRTPSHCFKCGGIATMYQRQSFRDIWNLNFSYATVQIPLCEKHAMWIRRSVLWSKITLFVGLVSLIYQMPTIGVLFIFVALYLRQTAVYSITAKRITPEFVTLKGAGKEFLEKLPEYPEK